VHVDLPVYVAALGPANLRLTGELADGWIGNSFLPESAGVFLGPLAQGAAAAGRELAGLDLSVSVAVEFTDDVAAAGRRHARGYAFTFGAMGSPTRNFYNEAFARQGFGDDVREVQRLWLAGDREAAAERVPVEIGLRTNLVGTDEVIRQRLRLYRDAGITTLRVSLATPPAGQPAAARLDQMGRLLDLVKEVNAEGQPAG
jgi:alkanesulfonate monooxygenase SsuD/methylene tetrahydromethanopterin reductase-like flavin-dependent oxidoreductase (luciferase family)